MKPQKRKSENSENFPTSKKLKPKTGYLVEAAPYDPVRASGREIGHLANIARAKTAESLLEFARLVYAAYSRFYEPWKVVGRKSNKRIKEARQAETNWQDFLTELGWDDFPRHQKTVRAFAAIGAKYDLLIQKSDSLPSAVSALTVLVKKSKTERQLLSAVSKCSPDITAAEVKQLFIPKDADASDVLSVEDSLDSVKVLECDLTLCPESIEANGAVLALLFALEMNEESLSDGASVEGLAAIDAKLAATVRAYIESDAMKALINLYDERISQSDLVKTAIKKRTQENEKNAKEIRETRERLSPTKTRDYSNLKV